MENSVNEENNNITDSISSSETNNSQAINSETITNNDINNNDIKTTFNIPEEFKDKAWTKNIKNEQDLFKAYDNAQSLIGKKTIGIPDFEKASEEELKEFYSKTAPKDINEYQFNNMPDSDKEFFGNLFKDNGINKKQAQNILTAYENYQEKFLSEDDFVNEIKNRFGENYQTITNESTALLRKYLSNEDKQILEKLPNKVLGSMLSFANNLKQAYGINLQSNVDNKVADNIGYTRGDYEKQVLEMFSLEKQGKLTEQMRQDYTNKLKSISKNIKW